MKRRTKVVMLVMAIGVLGILLAGCKIITGPYAQFSATPARGEAPLTVRFDASASSGSIVAYEWSFGDGATGYGKIVDHYYRDDSDKNNDGVNEGYTVTLTVTNDKGIRSSCSGIVYVSNPRPVARFSFYPQGPLTLEKVYFNAEASYDPAKADVEGIIPEPIPIGRVVSWQWSFGDGTTGSGKFVSHEYEDDSDFDNDGINEGYIVTLVVADDDGAQGLPYSQKVIVWNRPPVAHFVWTPCSLSANEVKKAIGPKGIVPEPSPGDVCLELDSTPSDDPDGEIVYREWWWYDEFLGNQEKLLLSLTPGYGYDIKLIVFDDDGAVDSRTRWVSP